MIPCNKKYADFYEKNSHRLPGLPRPKECPDVVGLEEPTLTELAENFTGSMTGWASAGFPVVSQAVYDERAAICATCDFWDPKARMGFGKCRHKKCGCTRFKRWLVTEKCPAGKWLA